MKKTFILLQAIIIIFCIFVANSYAVPNLISYQGILNDSTGTPMSTTVNMAFTLYDTATGGTALWNETQNVQVANGLFNVKLGSVQQITQNVLVSDFLYIGIQVGSDPEMLPRQRITAGAYVQSVIPIGTINSWAKNIPGVPPLSDSWVECNGQVLNDLFSPLNGQTIPDLNNQHQVLKGDSMSGATSLEDFLPNHAHSIMANYGGDGVELRCGGDDCRPHSGIINNNAAGTPTNFFHVVWIIKVK